MKKCAYGCYLSEVIQYVGERYRNQLEVFFITSLSDREEAYHGERR